MPESAQPFRNHRIYGIVVRSEIPLGLPEADPDLEPDVVFRWANAEWFSRFVALHDPGIAAAPASWYRHFPCGDGSHYVQWHDLFQFVVEPEGRVLTCYRFENAHPESFETYILGQALSFALVKQGYEPLHATAVVIEGKAVAFLGDSGYGKSTLAASFVAAGYPLLTDDMLVIRDIDGVCHGFPGPSRIKLLPEPAHRFLPRHAAITPVNPEFEKLIIRLANGESCTQPVPLHALYLLNSSVDREPAVSIEPLTGSRPLLELLRSAFNVRLTDPARLGRQFAEAQRILSKVNCRGLTYARDIDLLPQVREAVVSDVRGAAAQSL